jgi:hypothetical protein
VLNLLDDQIAGYTTTTGVTGFLGVETKYTEPFTPTVFSAARYESLPAYRRRYLDLSPVAAAQGAGWPNSGSKGRRSDGQTVPRGGVVRSTR